MSENYEIATTPEPSPSLGTPDENVEPMLTPVVEQPVEAAAAVAPVEQQPAAPAEPAALIPLDPVTGELTEPAAPESVHERAQRVGYIQG